MVRTYLGGRVVASRQYALLALGDLVALLVFATVGEYRHGGTTFAVFRTAVQFGIGWVVFATLVGAYGPRALDGRRRAALLGAVGWAGGAVIGAFVRLGTEAGAGIVPVFVLVTAGVGAVIFALWRGVAAGWL